MEFLEVGKVIEWEICGRYVLVNVPSAVRMYLHSRLHTMADLKLGEAEEMERVNWRRLAINFPLLYLSFYVCLCLSSEKLHAALPTATMCLPWTDLVNMYQSLFKHDFIS